MEPADNKPYIRETIEKPRASFGKKLLLTVFFALVFGAVAAITFVFGKNFAQRFVTTTETDPPESVIFPIDDPQGSTEATVPEASSSLEEMTSEETSPSSSSSEETGETKDPEGQIKAILESLLAADRPGVEDLQQLYAAASGLVGETNSAIVSVSIARKGTDAFGTEYTYDEQIFGVIIAITSKEILILTPYAETGATDGSISVRFAVGDPADAYTKSTDRISGLTMLAVAVRGLDAAAAAAVRPVELGNSYNCTAGQPVIALGAPAGAGGSVRYGILTHISEDTGAVDNTARLLHTDMAAAGSPRGFLIDLDGKMIGWFGEAQAADGVITAIGVSDIKIYLQNMSNGLSTAYLGITGQTLTADVREKLGVEENGVYIVSCAEDSPAISAGLMSGDIIVSISGEPITGMMALKTKLQDMNTEQTVKITVLRGTGSGYQPLDFDVHLERR